MKLYFGSKSKKELILIKKFLSAFEILKLNEEITDLSLNLIEIYSKSHSLKIPDALIGATSLNLSCPSFLIFIIIHFNT